MNIAYSTSCKYRLPSCSLFFDFPIIWMFEELQLVPLSFSDIYNEEGKGNVRIRAGKKCDVKKNDVNSKEIFKNYSI